LKKQREFVVIRRIPGFPGYYASDDGKVYGPKYGFKKPLKHSIDSLGYRYVGLTYNHKSKRIRVHNLMIKTFINNTNKKCVNHIDGNKLNNNINNLELCSSAYNNKHAYDIGLKKKPNHKGIKHPSHKLTEKDVLYIRRIWNKTNNKTNLANQLAQQFNVGRTCICNIVYNWTWRHV
jgi:hypothetical protein